MIPRFLLIFIDEADEQNSLFQLNKVHEMSIRIDITLLSRSL